VLVIINNFLKNIKNIYFLIHLRNGNEKENMFSFYFLPTVVLSDF
jgi:hypothetical protein